MEGQDLTTLEGVGEVLAQKLREGGIRTIEDLAGRSVSFLKTIGIREDLARKILKAAQEYCGDRYKFKTDEALIQEYTSLPYLTTGTKRLDRILGGKGFRAGTVYEIYGPPGSGKSNLLFQLLCTAFLPSEQGGLGTGTIFIDTERTFSLTKVQQVARRFGIAPEKFTPHIIRSAPPTSDILIYFCDRVLPKMVRETGARLVCLDSIATPLRTEYGGKEVAERQQKVNLILHALKRFVQDAKGIAILTNQTTTAANPLAQQRPWRHALGFIEGHEAHVRLMLRTLDSTTGLREVQIEKALDIKPGRCEIYLNIEGFTDASNRNQK